MTVTDEALPSGGPDPSVAEFDELRRIAIEYAAVDARGPDRPVGGMGWRPRSHGARRLLSVLESRSTRAFIFDETYFAKDA